MSHRLYSTAVGHIVDKNGYGDFTTIQAAITAAASGDTVFIRANNTAYSENLTLKAGVNLSAFGSDSSLNATGRVIISGTCTLTTAGTVTISGIQLQTNSAALLAVTGSANSVVNLENCYLNCTNNTGITYSSSGSTSGINVYRCEADLGTTGIGLYTHSGAGTLRFQNCRITNSGASTTASSNSAGLVQFDQCNLFIPISNSSTGTTNFNFSLADTSAQNTTTFTTAGSGTSNFFQSRGSSGSASTISIGSGTTVVCQLSSIGSSNANAITGSGTIAYQALAFTGSSQTINTTTQSAAVTIYGSTTTAPTAGGVGEEFTNAATGVSTTSTQTKSIANITLTPGIWDISGISQAVATGGTAVMTSYIVGISTTNNSFTGTSGEDQIQLSSATGFNVMSLSVPRVRVTITTSTTYYLSVQTVYTSTTCPVAGRISATRVG